MLLEFGWAELSGEEVGELFERCGRWPVEECPPGDNFITGERKRNRNLAGFGDSGAIKKEVHAFEETNNGEPVALSIERSWVGEFERRCRGVHGGWVEGELVEEGNEGVQGVNVSVWSVRSVDRGCLCYHAIGRPREEWRQEVRFIILQVSVFCRCTSRDVTVFLLHLPLLKNDTMLLLTGCDHVYAIV